MKKSILTVAILLCSFAILKAGDHNYTIGETISFKSEILNEERSIIVYTPVSYALTSQSYPVMYLLDGGGHFHHASGIVQFLSSAGLMPEMVVVAIKNIDRTRDFSPTHVDQWPTTGGAEKFLGFIEEELIPFVGRNYRSNDYKMLVGHSFGGEFAAYALLNKPEVFNSYIAISPYMMYDDNFIIQETKSKLKSKYPKEIQFFMTVGGEETAYFETLSEFEEIVETKSPKNFKFSYTIYEGNDHSTVPHMSIYDGLESIFSGWKMPKEVFMEGLASIDKYYEILSKKFDYKISTPEMTINNLGYYYMNEKQMDKSIMVFKENVSRFPKSANVYDSLGEAYENNKQLKEAMENYRMAVDLAKQSYHPNLGLYSDNLKRVQERMEMK